MPWKGVTVSEQRQRFIEDFVLNYYSMTELADRFSISRKTAHTHPGHQGKWINRHKEHGQAGLEEQSRRPRSCPWQTPSPIVEELISLRKAHPRWGPKKLLDVMERRDPERKLPAISTAARILTNEGLVKPRRRYRRAHPGCPPTVGSSTDEGRRAQRHLAGGLQGTVPAEERKLLLPADGERSGEPLRPGL